MVFKVYRINVQRLEDALIADHVVSNIASLSEMVSLPSVAVMVDTKTTAKDAVTTVGVDVVSGYLQNSGFEVTALEANARVKETMKKAMMISGEMDSFYLLALQNGAEVYVVLNVSLSSRTAHNSILKKASVSLKAYCGSILTWVLVSRAVGS